MKGATVMKVFGILLGGCAVFGLLCAAGAQADPTANANLAVKISEQRTANANLMKQYTWHSRTDVSVDGEVKDTTLDLVNYGPDGKLQHSLVSDEGAPLSGGPLRRHLEKEKREEMRKFLAGVAALLEQYTLPTAGKILDFMNQATTSGPDATGLFQMTGQGVVVPGDTFSIWADAQTHQARKAEVSTTYAGDAVTVAATYATLPSGLTYMSHAEAKIPAKKIAVEVQNFDFSRPN